MSKILVIDDDPIIRTVIQKALEHQGHNVVLATNGHEGIEQAAQLKPALIICDWVMPVVDGLEVCRRVKSNPQLSTTFFVLLTSRDGVADRIAGLDNGADDFLAKPINIGELQARVRAGLRLYQLGQDLQVQKQLLENDLAEAACYVRSLLPPPLKGPVNIEACFIPSQQLGGDCFDYFWLDSDYLVFYLLDVSGHGIGAALPSSLILNLLRLQSLPDVNFYQPREVLRALNETFQMSHQNEKYFTIWYGVYNRVKRQLDYASAGHPPAILLTPGSTGPLGTLRLRTPNLPIGMMPNISYVGDRCYVPPGSTLYVFSDGVYEIPVLDPQAWGLEAFINLLVHASPQAALSQVLLSLHKQTGIETFEDDLSLLQIKFV
jgi:sigma-B regulation protein RsbU (phosphoserine phosphatase)